MSFHTLQVALTRALVAAKEEDDDALTEIMREVFIAWTAHRDAFTTDDVLDAIGAADEITDEHATPLVRHDATGDLDDEMPTIADQPIPGWPDPIPAPPVGAPLAHRVGRAEDVAKMSRVRAALAGNDPVELVAALAACYGLTGPLSMGFDDPDRLRPETPRPAPVDLPTFPEAPATPADDLYLTVVKPRAPTPPARDARDVLAAELTAVRELATETSPREALAAVLTQGFSQAARDAAVKAIREATAHDDTLNAWVRTRDPEALAEWLERGTVTEGIESFAFTAWCNAVDRRPILVRLRDFLGEKGLAFFRELREEHGDTSWPTAVIKPEAKGRAIPYSVHFNEGMQIRNWLRAQPELVTLRRDDRWLDDHWGDVINAALDGHDHVALGDLMKTYPFPPPEGSDDIEIEPAVEAEAAEGMTYGIGGTVIEQDPDGTIRKAHVREVSVGRAIREAPRGFTGWQCDRCSHVMRENHPACPKCGFTVFSPLRDLPEEPAKSDESAKPAKSPPAREVATAESDAERRAKDEAATPRGRTAPQPPDPATAEWAAEAMRADLPTGEVAIVTSTIPRPQGMRGGYLIFDTGDSTYHTGGGDWSPLRDEAFIYNTKADAQAGIEDVDNDAIMRERLTIVPRRPR